VGLLADIDAMGLCTAYDKFVIKLEPVLEAMSARGIPVSPAEHARVTAELTATVAAAELTMQAMVPDEVRGVQPKLGYKRVPKDTSGMVQRDFAYGDELDGDGVARTMYETRWCKLKPWKPSGGATGGLIRYMKHKKHPVPRAFKTDTETTAELELRRLAKSTRDPLYLAVIEYRELKGLLTNHVKNWEPGGDGRVHPTFYYETGTGQLGARRPNSMNAPKHKKNQGDIFRSMIVAKEGHTLVELDYKSFHVQTLAFEARDPDLLRLGKLDIHSFLTAHFLRLPDADRLAALTTEDLRAALARIKREHKQVRDAKVKHALLGYNNGMGYRKCYYQYMEFFDGQNEAKRIFELLDSLFPRAKAYRQRICDLAHSQGYLISRFGCIRWFWEVYKWSGGKWTYGEDHEAALSFFTQNDGHCTLKDAMLRIDAAGWAERYRMINPMHDALMFEVPDAMLATAVPALAVEMERPSDVLINSEVAPTGLAIEVEAHVGKSWNRMQTIDWRTYGQAG
jgi:DNA polymerase I-like protein with 3'-5' exonuclease and polymerase domains